MERSRLTLGSGSHYAPFSRMRNTSRQTSYVVLVGTGAPVVVIVALQSTFEAMFLAPEDRPASEGPVLSLLFPTTTVEPITYPSAITLGLSPRERPLGSVLPTISLAVLRSDHPGCSVRLL